jgi:hypothetical protein
MSNFTAQWNSLAARLAPGLKQNASRSFMPLSARQGATVTSGSGSGSSPLPNVWVEKGVIWNVATNLAMGFTSYSSLTDFVSAARSSFPGYGLESGPKTWYTGAFSQTDMPMLVQKSTKLLLIWPSLVSIPFAAKFLSELPVSMVYNPASGSPALAPSTAQSFQALSPDGQKTFQAKYLLFSHVANSGTGIAAVFTDLVQFGWWYT